MQFEKKSPPLASLLLELAAGLSGSVLGGGGGGFGTRCFSSAAAATRGAASLEAEAAAAGRTDSIGNANIRAARMAGSVLRVMMFQSSGGLDE